MNKKQMVLTVALLAGIGLIMPELAHAGLESSLMGIKSKLPGSNSSSAFRDRDCDCWHFFFHRKPKRKTAHRLCHHRLHYGFSCARKRFCSL